ncbi:hypothetical protein NFI08_15925 [Halomonas sp. EF61]|uniref:hypothetical protein n=1 Tax=Halomonas sp. EF61 TaxID=2950869 RepID=UPI0032DE746B
MAYDACQKNIPPETTLCSEPHCNNFRQTSTMAKYCKCQSWDGKPIPDCKPHGGSFPVEAGECYNTSTQERLAITMNACLAKRDQDKDWEWRNCYCCCSCFAWGTRVAVGPDSYKVVESIALNDPLLTTRVKLVDGKPSLHWESRPATFSDGMAPTDNQSAVLVQYGEEGELVVTPDQPMLMADGTLKSADRLTTDDHLVDRQGAPVKVEACVLGKQRTGFHSLSAQRFDLKETPGWFLETNGVVAGDHMVLAMQDGEDLADMFAPGHDDLPKLGSADYATDARGAVSASAALGHGAREIASFDFTPIDESLTHTSPVPYGATPYVTQAQARDIADNGTFRGLSETFLVNEFDYLATLFSAFHPQLNFYLNWEDLNPNMFAFAAYGQHTVYLSGQLLRLEGLYKQGLAMLMSQGAARFLPHDVGNDSGLLCTGPADYSGANQVLQQLFYGDYMVWATKGYQQIAGIFALIDPANRVGQGVCSTPSIPCRLEAIDAAISGLPLPACAGGPVAAALKLESACWTCFEGTTAIKVSFNLRLNRKSATDPWHYRLSDTATKAPSKLAISLVQMDQSVPDTTWLIVEGEKPEQALTLSVGEITADNASTLDPDATSVEVKDCRK